MITFHENSRKHKKCRRSVYVFVAEDKQQRQQQHQRRKEKRNNSWDTSSGTMFSPENSFGFLSVDKILNRDDEPHSILLIQMWIEYEPERGHHDSSNCQLEYDYNQLLRFQHNMFAAPAIIGTHTQARDMNFTAKNSRTLIIWIEFIIWAIWRNPNRWTAESYWPSNRMGSDWLRGDGEAVCGGMKDNIPFWRMFQAVLYM